MKKNEPIEKIMSKNVITCHLAQKMSDVRKLMLDNKIHHCPVVSNKTLIGLLSTTDIMGLSIEGIATDQRSMDAYLDHQFSIEEQMIKDVRTIPITGTVRDAATLLSDGKFHALPVVDGDELVGIVTTTDIINYLIKQY